VAIGTHALAFEAMGLDHAGEIKIQINGQEVFVSELDPSCLRVFCPRDITLPAGLLQPGVNQMQIIHQPTVSDYLVRSVSVRRLVTVGPDQLQRAVELLSAARRRFEDRLVSADNLFAARRVLEEASQIVHVGDEAAGLRAEIHALRELVDKDLLRQAEELVRRVERNERLGHQDDLRRDLQMLLRIHPDPASRENMSIQKRLLKLKEASK